VLSATHLLTTAVRTTVTFAELAVESLVQPMSSRALRRELVASLAGECRRHRPLGLVSAVPVRWSPGYPLAACIGLTG